MRLMADYQIHCFGDGFVEFFACQSDFLRYASYHNIFFFFFIKCMQSKTMTLTSNLVIHLVRNSSLSTSVCQFVSQLLMVPYALF